MVITSLFHKKIWAGYMTKKAFYVKQINETKFANGKVFHTTNDRQSEKITLQDDF